MKKQHVFQSDVPLQIKKNQNPKRLKERHFIQPIPHSLMHRRSKPSVNCAVCNFTKNQLAKLGYGARNLPRKSTSYMCKQCKIPVCIYPCFEIYHTLPEYRKYILRK